MAGSSSLVCQGFIEGEGFTSSKDDLKVTSGLTDRQIDDRLSALLWALRRDPEANAGRVPTRRNLWVAVIPRGIPPLRIFLRPRPGVPDECELMWIEEWV